MSARRLLLVIAACLAVWASLLPLRGVWAPDEARYAEVTREMAQEHRWIVPVLNGELYTQKPPLFYDLARIASLPTGRVPEWAVKVPSLASAAAVLLFIGLIGGRLAGAEAAWLAPLLLGSMVKFSWQAQFGQIDMVLTALVVAQIYVGLRVSSGDFPRRTGLGLLAVLGTAGVLAKGPVGCILPWLVLAAYLALRREWPSLRRLGLHWVIPAVLLLCASWLLYAGVSEGWAYPEGLLFKQSVTRYFEPWHHKAPAYYYLGILFTDGLPYSLLLVPMAAPLLRKRAWKEPAALLPLTWMGVYLLFFSLSPGKRSVYLLPLFPAMALLLAAFALNIRLERWSFKGFGRTLLALALLFAVTGAVGLRRLPGGFRALWLWLLLGTVLLTFGCLAAWYGGSRKRLLTGFGVMASCTLAFFLFTGGAVVRALDPVKAPRKMGEAIHQEVSEGARIAVFPSLVPSINYYARSRTRVFGLTQREEAAMYLRAQPNHLLLVRKEDWGALEDSSIRVLARTSIGRSVYLLLRRKADGPPASGGPPSGKQALTRTPAKLSLQPRAAPPG